MVLLGLRDFIGLGSLQPHERVRDELRDTCRLHYVDKVTAPEFGRFKIIFFSHQVRPSGDLVRRSRVKLA